MTARLRIGAALLLTVVAACSDGTSSAPPDPPGPAATLRLNEAWLAGTHNSYWVDRGVRQDLFSSGVQESLLDQLVADGARAIELDVHPDDRNPHRYRVFHTVPGNSLCDDLADCLRPLRLLHAALPRHETVHVVVELKKFSGSSFDAEHSVDDLEAILEESLGPWLYRPRDLLDACDPDAADSDPDLTSCLARVGWPSVAAMRGRFVVSVLGNFDDLLPQAKGTLDWATFTLHGDLRTRTAFSMASSWKLDWDALPQKIRDELSRDALERARRRAVFLQVEDTADPNLPVFLEGGAMVRIDGAFTVAQQLERSALGAQILQGDTPWIQAEDRGPDQPLRPLDASLGEIVEPGSHVELVVPAGDASVARWRDVPAGRATRWATLPSIGGESDALPCLAAAAADDDEADSLAICRDKVHASRTPGAALGSGRPDSEALHLVRRVCRAGLCRQEDVTPVEQASDGAAAAPIARATLAEQATVGVMLGLEVTARDGRSCAQALVAVDASDDGEPLWHRAGEPECLAEPLRAQGLLVLAQGGKGGPAVFAGTSVAIDGRRDEL
ncbi:hypothetical protein K2Z84_09840 [Candidatus Binatia bacterium]|nr:hypothetical protein [Candidatus Binatia bacterium]